MTSPPHAAPPGAASGWQRSDTVTTARAAVTAWRPTSLRAIGTATATLLVAIALCLPIGAAVQIVLAAQLDDHTPTQAMIVLDPVRNWGSASPVIRERALHAAELYREGVAPVILLPGTTHSAQRAAAVLIAQGIPADDIVAVPTGADMVGSLRAMAEVLRGMGWSTATIVTDPAQAARVQATSGGLGIDAHVSPTDAGAGTSLTSEYVGRETVALLRYYLLTRWTQDQVVSGA